MALSTYAPLIEWLGRHGGVPGPILEIGTFLGDGTLELASAFPGVELTTVDSYLMDDPAENEGGVVMGRMYRELVGEADQWQVVGRKLGALPVRRIKGDSRLVELAGPWWLVVIDGGHQPDVVRSDWERFGRRAEFTAFHDYGHDLPRVTEVVDEIIDIYDLAHAAFVGYAVVWERRHDS